MIDDGYHLTKLSETELDALVGDALYAEDFGAKAPTDAAIRDLIDQDGGPLVPGAIGEVLRNEDFLYALASLSFLEAEMNSVSAANIGPPVTVHVTRSLSFGATVRMVGSAHAAIM